MNAIKGIYHNGVIELIEKPETQEISEVLIIFPEKKKIPIFEAVEILLEIHWNYVKDKIVIQQSHERITRLMYYCYKRVM